MQKLDILAQIKANTGTPLTTGLSADAIADFLSHDSALGLAIDAAWEARQNLSESEKRDLMLPESELIRSLQAGLLNFYAADGISPYIPLAAQGPWIVTAYGAVIYDAGGYGMLGAGHNPQSVGDALARPQVMANVMTPNFNQKRLVSLLRKHIGFKRGGCPYTNFVWMNSGSEAVTVACRVIDAHTREVTDPGGRHSGKNIFVAAAKVGFHGRTDSAARVSDSSIKNYRKYLASFRDRDNLLTFEMNNLQSLKDLFDRAIREKFFIEALFLEPVMGEGDPGCALTREFYDLARKLTKEHGAFLVIDSIQAGLRAHGCLSIVDYPGFEDAQPPEMETYSKALNAGQFPLSVLALTAEAAGCYKVGLYGNTMTTNPRGLEVARAVLERVTPQLAENIRQRGKEYLEKFKALQAEVGGIITKVQGTGLLFGIEISGQPVLGTDGLEHYMRVNGVNVIHGGPHTLRFTPHFASTSKEVDLVVGSVRQAINHFKKNFKVDSSKSNPISGSSKLNAQGHLDGKSRGVISLK